MILPPTNQWHQLLTQHHFFSIDAAHFEAYELCCLAVEVSEQGQEDMHYHSWMMVLTQHHLVGLSAQTWNMRKTILTYPGQHPQSLWHLAHVLWMQNNTCETIQGMSVLIHSEHSPYWPTSLAPPCASQSSHGHCALTCWWMVLTWPKGYVSWCASWQSCHAS